MSRTAATSQSVSVRFPRVSGDEPRKNRWLGHNDMFSPRERG